MSAGETASPRRATIDAVALAIAFIVVDAAVIAAALADLVEWTQAIVTVLALGAIVLLLFRDDVMNAIAAGNEMLVHPAEEAVRRELDGLVRSGWTVEHDVAGPTGRRGVSLVQGPPGAFLVLARNRAYRLEHLGRAKHHAAWLNARLGRWVTPVVCLGMRDDTPHRRNGVWVTGVEHLAEWLGDRPAESSR
jgi:hypothetical protein